MNLSCNVTTPQELREEIVSLLMHRAAQHESLAKNTVTARCRHEFTYAAHVLGDLDKAAMTLVRLLNDTDFSKFDTETAIDLTGEVHRLINRLEGTYQPRGNSDLYIPKAEHEAILARALRTTHTSED